MFQDFRATWRRFPLPIGFTMLGTAVALITSFNSQIELTENVENTLVQLLAMFLGLYPASITVKLIDEKNHWDIKQKIFGYAVLGLIGIILYLITSESGSASEPIYSWQEWRMYVTMKLLFLSVFFVPFVTLGRISEANAFWQFAKRLIERLIQAVFFSGAIFIGITLTLRSIDFLFDININVEYYPRIWIFCAGVIAQWIFLSGIPENLSKLENEKNYNELLKKFIKLVLVPFITIYTLVLYAYGAKIIVTGIWPNGEIVYMIAGYLTAGLITYLLAYPLLEKNTLAKKAAKVWITALIPVLLLYAIAITLRVGQYGFTAERYLVVALGISYVIVCLYLLLSKKKNIILIPLIFSTIALIGNFGPLSAYSVSKWSQLNRLEKLRAEENMNLQEIEKITEYLVSEYGPQSVENRK